MASEQGKHLDRERHPAAARWQAELANGRLCATRLSDGRLHFPPLLRDPADGGKTTWEPLPLEGTLHAFTTQETALRHAAPEVLCLVEIDEVVVPAVTEMPFAQLRIGQPVRLTIEYEEAADAHVLRASDQG